jgi:hypothetical protein
MAYQIEMMNGIYRGFDLFMSCHIFKVCKSREEA